MEKQRKHYLTKEGTERLRRELESLKEVKLSKIRGDAPRSFRFGEADPEYLAFQEDVGRLEEKIVELEDVLGNYQLIKVPPKDKQDMVFLGAKVLVEMDGEMEEFTIADTLEVDPVNNKISDQSPIGKALLNRRVGEIVEVKTPIVTHLYKIIKIKYEEK